MSFREPIYRTEYVGETITGYHKNGEAYSVFVQPRENIFTPTQSNMAIVLGNGLTKNYNDVQNLIRINSSKLAEGYKLTYACNRAVSDQIKYDYYVLKSRAFLAEVSYEKLSQGYLPNNIFLDYKENSNLIPFKNYLDAGATAAYLAAFDGHKKVFLFGFDGNLGVGWQTVYDGVVPYVGNNNKADFDKWTAYLFEVMKMYPKVEFIRLQLDGQKAPFEWRNLSNFRDSNLREVVLAGDF